MDMFCLTANATVDVVLQTTEGAGTHDGGLKPGGLPFEIAPGLQICKLDEGLVEKILDACEPVGFNYPRPTRQFGHSFALVRENPPNPPIWDEDLSLLYCVALSRLVHATSIAFHYAAQIETDSQSDAKRIIPAAVRGDAAMAFVLDIPERKWLTQSELDELKELYQALNWSAFPNRVKRAFWYHESAARAAYRDDRWTFLSTALEALIHTDDRGKNGAGYGGSTKQFKTRIPLLAKSVSLSAVSEADAETAYGYRSLAVHGPGLTLVKPSELSILRKFEELLSAVLKRCIRDSGFPSSFSSDASIRAKFPL